jgi:hypothetical protein
MIHIVISIIVAIVAWYIIMLISVNLLGHVVRGLLWSPPFADDPPLSEELKKLVMTPNLNFVMTSVAIVLAGAYYFSLYHFWNIGLVVAAGLIMLSRLPGLLWEMMNGGEVYRATRIKLGSLFTAVAFFISIPLVWYSLYKWPS